MAYLNANTLIITLNVNSINLPNEKAQIFRVNKKRKQDNYFLLKRNPSKYKDTDRLKVKVERKHLKVKKDLKISSCLDLKKAGMAVREIKFQSREYY